MIQEGEYYHLSVVIEPALSTTKPPKMRIIVRISLLNKPGRKADQVQQEKTNQGSARQQGAQLLDGKLVPVAMQIPCGVDCQDGLGCEADDLGCVLLLKA